MDDPTSTGPSRPRRPSITTGSHSSLPARSKARRSDDIDDIFEDAPAHSPARVLNGYSQPQPENDAPAYSFADDSAPLKSTRDGRGAPGVDEPLLGKIPGGTETDDLHLHLDLDGNGGIQMDEVDAMIAENERDGAEPRGGGEREDYDDGAVHLANLEQRKAIWWKNVIVTGMFVLSWYAFATILSLYNKWMFSPEYYGFSYPLFVTFCHMIVQFCLAALIRLSFPKRFKPAERPTRQDYIAKILPAAVSTGGDIGLSNLSLKTITLSLYTMCKSSTLIFVLIFAFVFHLEKYSLRLVGVITLISFGVFLMVFNTTSVSVPGIVMVFSASALSGLRWALTETIMHKRAMGLSNPFATIFWLAPLMALTLGLVSFIVEDWSKVFGGGHFEGLMAFKTTGVIVLPGAVAFSMVASEYFIIQRAGIVPLSITGIFKEISTISFSAWLFGDRLTELNIIGVVIAIGGITLYTYHKYQKSIMSPVPLDKHGRPIEEEALVHEHMHEQSESGGYERAPMGEFEMGEAARRGSSSLGWRSGSQRRESGLGPGPTQTQGQGRSKTGSGLVAETETHEDRVERTTSDFESWNDDWREDEEEDDEVADEEVERLRAQREGSGMGERRKGSVLGRSWGDWWEKEM